MTSVTLWHQNVLSEELKDGDKIFGIFCLRNIYKLAKITRNMHSETKSKSV